MWLSLAGIEKIYLSNLTKERVAMLSRGTSKMYTDNQQIALKNAISPKNKKPNQKKIQTQKVALLNLTQYLNIFKISCFSETHI